MRFTAHRSGLADGSFMLLVSPRDLVEDTEVIGRDIVFVVDVSGSMGGVPLDQTKVALKYVIEALHPSDRFDVLTFSDDSETVFGKLMSAQPMSSPRMNKKEGSSECGLPNVVDTRARHTAACFIFREDREAEIIL